VKKITESINAAVLAAMLLMTVGQIMFRSVLKISASWSEELIQYSFAFIVFVGAMAVTKEEGHITITMGLDMAPPAIKRIMRIVGRIIALPFLFIFTWGAFQNAQSTWTASLPTAEWMKIGYMYAVLFVSGCSMIVDLFINIVQEIRGRIPAVSAEGGDK
jgi:TRAP-type C4-dicarboxylate transport system permease small subunit